MAKFLNKKERVYDLKLTSYGEYLMSIGRYKPYYYAFFDDNITYDNMYNNISESQNSINTRIKEETSYLEGLVLFEDINNTQQTLISQEPNDVVKSQTDDFGNAIGADIIFKQAKNYYASDVTPIQYAPRKDIFRFDQAIGDALLDSKETDTAPAWKVVVLNGRIDSSTTKLEVSRAVTSSIPQVNITVDYKKQIRSTKYPTRLSDQVQSNSIRETQNSTIPFIDDNFIMLTSQDPIIYVDEVNTQLLTENFDIEVFIVTGSALERKYFEKKLPQIVDGLMVRSNPEESNFAQEVNKTAVEYYFNLRQDALADPEIVCKQLQIYNKSSYYIDLDIDCDTDGRTDVYNDIYGSEVQPEICLD